MYSIIHKWFIKN